jgi:hypothetical protein
MSSHAFAVVSKSPTEIEVIHNAEGHHYKFGVVRTGQGKRILSDTAEITPKPGAAHPPELYSGSARAFAISEAHRMHAID